MEEVVGLLMGRLVDSCIAVRMLCVRGLGNVAHCGTDMVNRLTGGSETIGSCAVLSLPFGANSSKYHLVMLLWGKPIRTNQPHSGATG